jgi:hypothetical protein
MRALAIFIFGVMVGSCTIGSFGGPKCSSVYGNGAVAFVCR